MSAFLIGSHLIMMHDLDCDQTSAIFGPLNGMLDVFIRGPHLSMLSCWRALHRSRALGWIDFREELSWLDEKADSVQMEEYLHYSR
jgi:hypothetical protein